MSRISIIKCGQYIWKKHMYNQMKKYGAHSATHRALKRPMSWKIIFYGTDNFSEVVLQTLNLNRIAGGLSSSIREIDVVCIEADCAVRRYAQTSKIKIYNWPYDVPKNQYDIGIVVSFGHLIPSKCIHACKHGMLNAHPSLLPRWRGAAPISHTLLNGDSETGVTILQVSPGRFDVGKILMQQRCFIPERCTSQLLTTKLADMAADMVLQCLKNLPQLFETSKIQLDIEATYAPKVTPIMGKIDWAQDSMCDIDRKFRALNSLVKIYTHWQMANVSLLELSNPEDISSINLEILIPKDVTPGFCFYHKKRKVLFVKCKDGWIGIKSLKLSGKRAMTAEEFSNGFLSKVNANLHYFNNNVKKFPVE